MPLTSAVTPVDTEVLLIGAGPVGLTLANLLGMRGQRALVLEARSELIDYPRGVGLDDESVRTLQTAGLWDAVRPYTVPHHVVRLVNGSGKVLVTNNPTTDEFGHPRKHGFIQPLVDRELAAGLDRFDGTELRFGHEVIDILENADHVRVTARRPDGTTVQTTARYVVGCEGGRSFTRSWLCERYGVEFEGKSPSTRWLVVDVDHDPLGTPSVYLGADPRRPYVSIGLPHGIRRWEFMLRDDEPTELVEDPAFVHGLLARHVPDPTSLDVIGQRVFSHHGRIATSFREGRVLLAGDAAHLMPVWLGQGWNSGIRDATNLAWKLTAVLRGDADDSLLDTYDLERRHHAAAMIDINMTAGTVMKCGPVLGRVRDAAATALNTVPRIKSWFTELRFKPMPRYGAGVVVDQATLTPGTSDASLKGSKRGLRDRLAPYVDSAGDLSPVGLQFIQPRVSITDDEGQRAEALLDDVLGDWWVIAAWGNDPRRFLSDEDLTLVSELGVRLVSFMPETQRGWAEQEYAAQTSPVPVTVIGDHTGRLKDWFDTRACGLVVIRPDRFVASACLAQQGSQAWQAVMQAASHPAPATATRSSDPVLAELPVATLLEGMPS